MIIACTLSYLRLLSIRKVLQVHFDIAIGQAIFEKNIDKLKRNIETYLINTISTFDTGNEAFYQGLIIGLCAIMNDRYSVRSNRESRYGRFDIQLSPFNKELPGFIIEIKSSKKDDKKELSSIAEAALSQIKRKRYDAVMSESGIKEIIIIGIAFRGKDIYIVNS